jgi:hypothetical protein
MNKRLLLEESWRVSKLVVKQFESRLDDKEIVESFHAVIEIIYFALKRSLEEHERKPNQISQQIEKRDTQDVTGRDSALHPIQSAPPVVDPREKPQGTPFNIRCIGCSE